MKVFGIDFTSSPSAKASKSRNAKWMHLATCELSDNQLKVNSLERLNGDKADDYTPLVTLLSSDGPWVAGIDVPFGMPIECIEYFQWLLVDDGEQTWAKYVESVRKIKSRKDFKKQIEDWRHPTKLKKPKKGNEPTGDKELVRKDRIIDRLIGAESPMNCIRPAVGSMFFEACYLLLANAASIPPVRLVSDENRHIVETYPRMVVNRLLLGSKKYKEADDLEDVRQQIVTGLSDVSVDSAIQRWYGLTVMMDEETAKECVADWDGDKIDSVLCAVQAAWASRQKRFGIPRFNSSVLNGVVALEGWVPDPFLAKWRATQ